MVWGGKEKTLASCVVDGLQDRSERSDTYEKRFPSRGIKISHLDLTVLPQQRIVKDRALSEFLAA